MADSRISECMLTDVAWWSDCSIRNDRRSQDGLDDECKPPESGSPRFDYGIEEGIQGHDGVCG